MCVCANNKELYQVKCFYLSPLADKHLWDVGHCPDVGGLHEVSKTKNKVSDVTEIMNLIMKVDDAQWAAAILSPRCPIFLLPAQKTLWTQVSLCTGRDDIFNGMMSPFSREGGCSDGFSVSSLRDKWRPMSHYKPRLLKTLSFMLLSKAPDWHMWLQQTREMMSWIFASPYLVRPSVGPATHSQICHYLTSS